MEPGASSLLASERGLPLRTPDSRLRTGPRLQIAVHQDRGARDAAHRVVRRPHAEQGPLLQGDGLPTVWLGVRAARSTLGPASPAVGRIEPPQLLGLRRRPHAAQKPRGRGQNRPRGHGAGRRRLAPEGYEGGEGDASGQLQEGPTVGGVAQGLHQRAVQDLVGVAGVELHLEAPAPGAETSRHRRGPGSRPGRPCPWTPDRIPGPRGAAPGRASGCQRRRRWRRWASRCRSAAWRPCCPWATERRGGRRRCSRRRPDGRGSTSPAH